MDNKVKLIKNITLATLGVLSLAYFSKFAHKKDKDLITPVTPIPENLTALYFHNNLPPFDICDGSYVEPVRTGKWRRNYYVWAVSRGATRANENAHVAVDKITLMEGKKKMKTCQSKGPTSHCQAFFYINSLTSPGIESKVVIEHQGRKYRL